MPGIVLATVTGTVGSTPQKPGSSALFVKNKLFSGTVGGGIVESKVQEYAEKCSLSGESALLSFALDNDISKKEEAICGGTISILVDASPMSHLAAFKEMDQSIANGIPGVLLTTVTGNKGQVVIINRYWMTAAKKPGLPEEYQKIVEAEVSQILASSEKTGFKRMENLYPNKEKSVLFFLEPVFPMPRLVIAGAGHIGKALSHLGRILDFEVIVIDDRHEFANPENLPDADHIIVKDIGEAVAEIPKDGDTYLVIVTRGHKDDAKALMSCINSGAGYTGMIGSKTKIAKMHEEFIAHNWASEEQWKKIYAPVGLEIGSKTVEEIAISIAAELVQVRSIRDKR